MNIESHLDLVIILCGSYSLIRGYYTISCYKLAGKTQLLCRF
jgi:hypothetical protein